MRYYNLKKYMERRFGLRVVKITLDAGLTCPNRDGSLSARGCIFCDGKGSGTGAARLGLTVREQLDRGLVGAGRRADKFIAYFQAFTNTYAPAARLKAMWDAALSHEDVIGLAVGTRPDCLPGEILDLLAEYSRKK
ncbi:MAG: TIGR01212 family radical SAM protein, partial [Thermodesulfobacteriota bacterium]|nr:TIGR01212 family radical SAM protein [Thermodesulfobacteriota bacterium]